MKRLGISKNSRWFRVVVMKKDKELLYQFKSNYWSYYLSLEERLSSLSKYIEFDVSLRNTYSQELFSLLQAVGSEVDVCGKSIAEYYYPDDDKLKDAHIGRWGFVVQTKLPSIMSQSVTNPLGLRCIPWANWRHEKTTDKNGKVTFKLSANKSNPEWWRAYNATKHRRRSLVHPDDSAYDRATLKNVLFGMAALYVLERSFLCSLDSKSNQSFQNDSKLFDFS